jgi:Zn-dependent peptidase ImmA (M78 family)
MSNVSIKALELLNNLKVVALPINPTMIAESLGIVVELRPFDDNLSGVLLRSNSRAVIGVNQSHHKNRQRFTTAHEIGHFYLNHQGEVFIDQFVLRRDENSKLAIDAQEIEANTFAAALLMPEHLIEAEINKLTFDISNERDKLLEHLSTYCQVSKQSIEYRLINIGYLPPF